MIPEQTEHASEPDAVEQTASRGGHTTCRTTSKDSSTMCMNKENKNGRNALKIRPTTTTVFVPNIYGEPILVLVYTCR